MNGVRKFAIPMIVLSVLIGIGLGLFMGWRVWPVTWYDTDPSDLRLRHQETWVIMAGDSLAVTGDIDVARQRLFELVDEETDWQWVANLVDQAAAQRNRGGDTAGELRLLRMAQSLNLPLPTGEVVTAPPPEGIVPATTPNWVLVLIALLAFAGALGIVIWLLVRIAQYPGAGASAEAVPVSVAAAAVTPVTPRATAPASEWVDPEDLTAEEALKPFRSLDEEELRELPGEVLSKAQTAPPPLAIEEEDEWEPERIDDEEWGEEEAKTAERPRTVAAPPAASDNPPQAAERADDLPPGALRRFEAEYRYGDDDFDCSFSIESEDGEFLGECGVGVADVLDVNDVQEIDAFEVWLFDKGDIRTVSKIVVSDLAHDDEELRQRLQDKGDLVVARPGTVIELETLSLRAEATILNYRYRADADLPDAIFEFLRVEMVVYEQG